MKNLAEIKRIIDGHKPVLKERFKVKSISVFGSYLKGQNTPKSDIDILVEFDGIIDLFDFIELENLLSDLLGSKVDLVMKDTLKPRIRETISKEAVSI
jgi:hypothetical protein